MKYILAMIIAMNFVACAGKELDDDAAHRITMAAVDERSTKDERHCFYTVLLNNEIDKKFVGYVQECYTECFEYNTLYEDEAVIHQSLCQKFYKPKVK